MSNVHKLPSNSERCFDESAIWIAKLDKGLSKDEEQRFKLWMDSSIDNKEMFMKMAKMWDKMDDLSRLSDLFPEPVSSTNVSGRKTMLTGLAVAASLVVAVLSVDYLPGFRGPNIEESIASLGETYETTVGEKSSVNLSDGSVMVLNTDSLVKVEYDNIHRLITLERGEIHIEVAHDKLRPLSIRAGDKVVQAVGTAFNIELYGDNKFELIVTEGEVRIGDRKGFESRLREVRVGNKSLEVSREIVRLSGSSLSVSEGEKLMFGSPVIEPPSTISADEIAQDLSWQSGNLVFTGETLAVVIDEISRYTSVEFIITDEELKKVRVAGLFRAGDVKGLLSALDQSFNIDSVEVDQGKVKLIKGQ